MSRKILQGSTVSPMISIFNRYPLTMRPVIFPVTDQKLIRSRQRKVIPGINLTLMPGVLLQDAPDALLVLYQTETFKAEKTDENIYQLQLAIIYRQGSSRPSSTAFSEQTPPQSKKKEPEIKRFRLPVAGAGGFEPATHGFGDRYSTS